MREKFTACAVALLFLTATSGAKDRPNVLFIAVDDMNDWISLLDPESPIKTPNLERLAARGALFTRAYCASPACNPSRVATLTGLRPSTSGVYGNKSDWRRALPSRKTIMQQFRMHGYTVRGAGKIFHHHLDGAFHDDDSFDEFQPMAAQNMPPEKLNKAPEYGSPNTDWGAWPAEERDTIDYKSVSYCIEALLNAPEDRPQFLACGIFKPHSPFFAPPKYHDSLTEILPPIRKDDDWNDLPSGATALMEKKKWFWEGMTKVDTAHPGSYLEFIKAYAACTRFADQQIGRLLDALDTTPDKGKTIIVLWSDHGFHLGEKNHIEKFSLWEKANHIPYLIVAPGVTRPGTKISRPVDLMSLYPTLLELAGFPNDPQCDGISLVPLLKNPDTKIPPALSTYGRGNHTVRSDRWRYIRYANGTEELYDHEIDPNEWNNLAHKAEVRAIIAEHRKWLPEKEREKARDLKRSRRTK